MASPPAGPDARLVEWGRTLLWLNLLATAVVFSTRTTEAFELPKTAVVRGVGIVLAVGLAAAWAGHRRGRLGWGLRGLAEDPVSLGVSLSLAAAAVSTVASVSPRTSLLGAQGSFAGLATLTAYAVAFFATRSLCRTPAAARGVLSGAVIGLGLAVAYGLVQVAGLDPLRWEAPIVFAGIRRVFSTQGHPNAFAQLLAMGTPIGVLFFARAARARRYGEAALLGLVCVSAILLTGLTLSRAGALALAAATIVMAWGWRHVGLPARPAVLVGVGLGAVAVVALALAIGPGEGLRAMVGRLVGLGSGSAPGELRRFLWAGAWGAFRDHPVFGAGVDCLSLVFGRYRTAEGWSAEWGETPLKAHCEALEILATRGLLGGAAALVLGLALWRAAVRAVRATSRDRELAVAAVAGLVAFAIHVSFHFPTAAGTSLALTLAAILAVLGEEGPRIGRDGDGYGDVNGLGGDVAGGPRLTAGVGLAAVVLAGALLYGLVLVPLRADVLGQAGTVTLSADAPRALALEREAVRLDPSRDLLWMRLAAALQARGLEERDPPRGRALLEEARRAAERGVALVPVNAFNLAHLATVLAELERQTPPLARRDEVEQAFERARSLDPNNPSILLAAGEAALAAGDLVRARRWGQLAASPYPRLGKPRGLLGAVGLVAGRQLAARGQVEEARAEWSQAALLLREGLAVEWRGDDRSRAAAEANLASVLAALGAESSPDTRD